MEATALEEGMMESEEQGVLVYGSILSETLIRLINDFLLSLFSVACFYPRFYPRLKSENDLKCDNVHTVLYFIFMKFISMFMYRRKKNIISMTL